MTKSKLDIFKKMEDQGYNTEYRLKQTNKEMRRPQDGQITLPMLTDLKEFQHKKIIEDQRFTQIVRDEKIRAFEIQKNSMKQQARTYDDTKTENEDDEEEMVAPQKFKGKPKMELDKYFETCAVNLKKNLEKVHAAKTPNVKVKYQAIINSLLLRIKRREDEMLMEENLRQQNQNLQAFCAELSNILDEATL